MSLSLRQSGFSLLAGLFLLVAVMLAALAMVTTSSSRATSTVLGLQSARAWFAARAAIDVATAQALAGGCAAVSGSLSIDDFAVELACSAAAVEEAGVANQIYSLQARAVAGSLAGNTFVSRRMQAKVSAVP